MSYEYSEEEIETHFTIHAERLGCSCLKLILKGKRGFPDRTIICPGGFTFFIEFKKPGGKLSRQQEERLDSLTEQGSECYVCDNFEDAARTLNAALEGHRGSREGGLCLWGTGRLRRKAR